MTITITDKVILFISFIDENFARFLLLATPLGPAVTSSINIKKISEKVKNLEIFVNDNFSEILKSEKSKLSYLKKEIIWSYQNCNKDLELIPRECQREFSQLNIKYKKLLHELYKSLESYA